jgi:hypothetical protein
MRRGALIAVAEATAVLQAVVQRSLRAIERHLRAGDAAALTAHYYRRAIRYREPWHRAMGLFAFERDAVARHLPPPPARVLVVGAGGGRDAVALQAMGYAVDACEPLASLAEQTRSALPATACVETCRAEDLAAAPSRLAGPYAAVIFGWGAWSHIFDGAARCAVLQALRQRVAAGAPLLLSWPMQPGASLQPQQRAPGQPADADPLAVPLRVLPGGIVHIVYGKAALQADADASGWRVVEVHGSETGYPHAILTALAGDP